MGEPNSEGFNASQERPVPPPNPERGEAGEREPLTVTMGGYTEIGARHREENGVNQDTLLLLPAKSTLLVGDGMGGEAGGAIAAKIANETVSEKIGDTKGLRKITRVVKRLRAAAQAANRDVIEAKGTNGELSGMLRAGTTLNLTTFWTNPDTGEITPVCVNVGDSQLVRVRDDVVETLTLDQTRAVRHEIDMPRHEYVGYLDKKLSLERAKKIQQAFDTTGDPSRLSSEDFFRWQRSSSLTAFVGGNLTKDQIDVVVGEPARPGDVYLQISDGMRTLTNGDIAEIVDAHLGVTPDELAQVLVAAAQAAESGNRGNDDDKTVGVTRINQQEEPPTPPPGSPEGSVAVERGLTRPNIIMATREILGGGSEAHVYTNPDKTAAVVLNGSDNPTTTDAFSSIAPTRATGRVQLAVAFENYPEIERAFVATGDGMLIRGERKADGSLDLKEYPVKGTSTVVAASKSLMDVLAKDETTAKNIMQQFIEYRGMDLQKANDAIELAYYLRLYAANSGYFEKTSVPGGLARQMDEVERRNVMGVVTTMTEANRQSYLQGMKEAYEKGTGKQKLDQVAWAIALIDKPKQAEEEDHIDESADATLPTRAPRSWIKLLKGRGRKK